MTIAQSVEKLYIREQTDWLDLKSRLLLGAPSQLGPESANIIAGPNEVLRSDAMIALHFIFNKFNGLYRKDLTTPLVAHSIALTRILASNSEQGKPVSMLTALLHDTLEDTKTSLVELYKLGFNSVDTSRITGYVRFLTQNRTTKTPEGRALFIERFSTAPGDIVNVELADRFHDALDIVYLARAPNRAEEIKRKIAKGTEIADGITRGRTDYNRQLKALVDYAIKQIK